MDRSLAEADIKFSGDAEALFQKEINTYRALVEARAREKFAGRRDTDLAEIEINSADFCSITKPLFPVNKHRQIYKRLFTLAVVYAVVGVTTLSLALISDQIWEFLQSPNNLKKTLFLLGSGASVLGVSVLLILVPLNLYFAVKEEKSLKKIENYGRKSRQREFEKEYLKIVG